MGQGELADQLTHEDMGAAAIGLPILIVASHPIGINALGFRLCSIFDQLVDVRSVLTCEKYILFGRRCLSCLADGGRLCCKIH